MLAAKLVGTASSQPAPHHCVAPQLLVVYVQKMQAKKAHPIGPVFLTHLSRELRDLIYLELWYASHGSLRQHIVWHGSEGPTRHFCTWPCSLRTWDPEDRLQEQIKSLVEEGRHVDAKLTRRLQSPWFNHWACGEDVAETTQADNAVQDRITTSFGPCWWEHVAVSREDARRPSGFMSLLRTCRTM